MCLNVRSILYPSDYIAQWTNAYKNCWNSHNWSIQIELYNLLALRIVSFPSLPAITYYMEAEKARDQGYILPSYSNHWLGGSETVQMFLQSRSTKGSWTFWTDASDYQQNTKSIFTSTEHNKSSFSCRTISRLMSLPVRFCSLVKFM